MTIPVWKKRFILIVGLLENLVFSGTIFGWSALNYMLKSEGVYQYVCDEIQFNNNLEYNETNEIAKKQILKRNADEDNLKERQTEFISNLRRINKEVTEPIINGTNTSALEESHYSNSKFRPNYQHQGCGAQDKYLNLAYTIGSFCMGFSAFIWGFLLEKWGLKTVRLLISCLITVGAVLLCVTNADRSILIFPAITLLSLGGVPLRIANMQFANLYPSKRSTIISLYSGAFCASAVIFVALKFMFDSGLSYFVVTLMLAIISLLMFPFTIFFLPSDRIREDSESTPPVKEKGSIFKRNAIRSSLSFISPVTLSSFTMITSPIMNRKATDCEELNAKSLKTIDENPNDLKYNNNDNKYSISLAKTETTVSVPISPQNNPQNCIPLKISLWSWAFNLHQWWFSWLITYMIIYAGSLNQWLQRVTTDIESANNFSKIYGCAQVLCLLLAPIAGLIMDHSVQKANKETDPFERKVKRVRACFWPLFITSLFLIACLLCRFFDNQTAIYVSIVFMTIFRAFLVAVGTSYLRIRFNGQHFNRLLGIMSTIASIVSLLQFPLFLWESQHPNNAFWVNIFNCFCTIIAFTNPIHIIITRLQRYLLRKEEHEEAEAKSQ